jgi:hypothetical protein
MADIRSTRAGENQGNVMSRKNKYHQKRVRRGRSSFTTQKMRQQGMKHHVNLDQVTAAMWGGGMNGMNLQSLLTGRMIQSVKGEQVGMRPS